MENTDSIVNVVLILIFLIILLLLMIAFVLNVIMPLIKDRRYIKMEMQRSEGEEYEYWEKELKKLYRYYIPLIGRFIR